jgi:hypothetical protein
MTSRSCVGWCGGIGGLERHVTASEDKLLLLLTCWTLVPFVPMSCDVIVTFLLGNFDPLITACLTDSWRVVAVLFSSCNVAVPARQASEAEAVRREGWLVLFLWCCITCRVIWIQMWFCKNCKWCGRKRLWPVQVRFPRLFAGSVVDWHALIISSFQILNRAHNVERAMTRPYNTYVSSNYSVDLYGDTVRNN